MVATWMVLYAYCMYMYMYMHCMQLMMVVGNTHLHDM